MFTIKYLFNLEKTIAKDYFLPDSFPWKVLDHIESWILDLAPKLENQGFVQIKPQVWALPSVEISPSAEIIGPCILDDEAQIRHCAYIRGGVIVGKKAVVGNSCEIKNSILFDQVQVPHFNYVGDSILGYQAHMGAGAITSNVKSDKSDISLQYKGITWESKRMKVGAMLGDFVEVGCNSVLLPGSIVGKNSTIYPLCRVRGVVQADSILKSESNIVKKRV